MTFFEFLDSFFGVNGATPYLKIDNDTKRKYLYLIVQRLALGGVDLTLFNKLYGIDTAYQCDYLYQKYGNIGYKPKYVFNKIDKTLNTYIEKNKDKIKQYFRIGLLGDFFQCESEIKEMIKQKGLHINNEFNSILRKKVNVA